MPLLSRILLWFFINLLLIGGLISVFLRVEFQLGFDSLLLGQTENRIRAVRDVLAAQLAESNPEGWDAILERFSDAYEVHFYLFDEEGAQVGGDTVVLPEVVRRRIAAWGPPLPEWRGWMRRRTALEPGGPPDGPPFGPRWPAGRGQGFRDRLERTNAPPPLGARPERGPLPRFVAQTDQPRQFWVGVRLPIPAPRPFDANTPPRPLVLLAMSESWAGSLFADPAPWLLLGGVIVVVSVLFWLPFVRGITRSIGRLTRVTEQIAEGDLEARVTLRRQDELGQLGRAINRMTERLSGFVTGQRRFLGDVAHELCSPLARCQVALGILEERAGSGNQAHVQDLQEELEHMAALVQELLAFARASLGSDHLELRPVALAATADRVRTREGRSNVEIRVSVPPDLYVLAEPELLRRSLANLVRNAVRYAGKSGPITISADRQGQGVMIVVGDSGPGIPEEHLERIFDPFYRVDPARDRESGGVGLGLAIVRTCVEAMGGRVRCRNRKPQGLEVALCLPLAQPPEAGPASAATATPSALE